MSLLSSITHIFKSRSQQPTASQPPATPRQGGLPPAMTLGGCTQPLAISTVFRCVRLLSESVANLPLQYLKATTDGTFRPDTTSALHRLLCYQPNPDYSTFDFWAQAVQQMLLDGNAYIVPQYNPLTLEPDRLTLCQRGTVSYDTINRQYYVNDIINGITGHYPEADIIHLKNLSIDGLTGVSTITFARLTADIATTGDRETLNRFANGGNVRGMVTNNTAVRGYGEYQDNELADVATDLDTLFQQGQRIVSLPGDAQFKQISLSSTDMQFLESRKFNVREICRFFGVHPSFVVDDTSNNYKSAEMANLAFLSNTLNPLLRKIETELQRKLIAPQLCHMRRFEFDRRSLYAADLDSRVRYQTQTIAAGIYTVNDWRRLENMPPVTGGDTPLVSANLRNLNQPNTNTPNDQQ